MSYNHLTQEDRAKIATKYHWKKTIREIAKDLGRSPSTISREIKRNREGKSYRSEEAQAKYAERRERCRRRSRLEEKTLVGYVEAHLLMTWSPEQIVNRMKMEHPENPGMKVSFCTIYRWLKRDLLGRSALLKQHLRHHEHGYGEKRGQFHGVRELKTRCREALRRKRVGHWEVDTIVSCRPGVRECLLNAVDRKSRYCATVLIKDRTKKDVMRGFQVMLSGLPVKTMTSDRGKEFACYQEAEEWFQAPFYFTRPYSPWQKPSVENNNGLIRQFFPKGTNFNEITPKEVEQVMTLLNNRPRKCLGWKTPAEVMAEELLHLT